MQPQINNLSTTLFVIVNLIIFFVSAPLLDGMVRKITARIQSRQGPPLWQTYYDLFKLLGKENIDSVGIMPFRMAPVLALSSIVVVLLFLPLGGKATIFTANFDTITLVYMLTLGGVAILMGAMASKSTYAIIGASREMVTMIMVEPILFMILMMGALKVGSLDLLSVIYTKTGFSLSSVLIILVSLFALQAFVGRQPFDIAEAETEILGGPFVEYSGPNYALFKFYLLLKQTFYAWLLVSVFVPITGKLYLLDLLIQGVGVVAVFVLIAVLGATHPRYRIDQAIYYYAGLLFVSLVAIGLSVYGY